MKNLFQVAGISKQALWKYNCRSDQSQDKTISALEVFRMVRKNHPRMGCRRIHAHKLNSTGLGRDAFERIGFANGFKLKRKRTPIKTTYGQTVEVFPNLIDGLILTGPNQVWQSDIFYMNVENKHYYAVTIIDVYSRELLALHTSKSLAATETVKAFKQALKKRKGQMIKGCIFHSDRGSQYISKVLKEMIRLNGLRLSMCKMPQENAYVERVQGTLKNEYLNDLELTPSDVRRVAKRIMDLYNEDRPHSSLKMLTPKDFMEMLKTTPSTKWPRTSIYKGFGDFPQNITLINKKEKSSKKEKKHNNFT
jgi:transposase InsO family protein